MSCIFFLAELYIFFSLFPPQICDLGR